MTTEKQLQAALKDANRDAMRRRSKEAIILFGIIVLAFVATAVYVKIKAGI